MAWLMGILLAAAHSGGVAPMAGMDHAEAPCPAAPAALPLALAGWARMAAVTAGATAARAPLLELGTGARAALLPTARVGYALRPGKPGGAGTSGGLFAFVAPAAGRYRVALGAGAWIDVVGDGKPVEAAAHGHGPDCSGVRKMVDFDLRPGRYLLQVAGNAGASLPLLVARLP